MTKVPYLGIYFQVLASNLIMPLPREYVANISLDSLCCGEIHFNVIWVLDININRPPPHVFHSKVSLARHLWFCLRS